MRGFAEIELLSKHAAALPNPVIPHKKLLTRACDGYDPNLAKETRETLKRNASTHYGPVFFNIQQRKSGSRTTIAKDFSNYQNTVSTHYQTSPVCV
jgi:hypothetical protein